EELVALARVQGITLQVGHIERFNPAVEELQRRPLQAKYVSAVRVSGYTGRSTDIGAVLDIMIHDIDLVLALTQSPVRTVSARGVSVLGGHEDMATAHVSFANGCVAHLTASRLNPAPLRQMQIWGPEGFAGIDFARRHLTLAQPAEDLRQTRLQPRAFDPSSFRDGLFG